MLHRERFAAFGYHVRSFSAKSSNFVSGFPLILSFADTPSAIHPLEEK